MKISKNVVIASTLIFVLLIFVFLIYLSILSRSVVYLDDAAIILITPPSEDFGLHQYNKVFATPATNLPGVYSIGMHVVIIGTGGDGLRVREEAGLDKTPLFLGSEGERFEIIEGPQIIDNSIWWKIRSRENPPKTGWAVQEYLK